MEKCLGLAVRMNFLLSLNLSKSLSLLQFRVLVEEQRSEGSRAYSFRMCVRTGSTCLASGASLRAILPHVCWWIIICHRSGYLPPWCPNTLIRKCKTLLCVLVKVRHRDSRNHFHLFDSLLRQHFNPINSCRYHFPNWARNHTPRMTTLHKLHVAKVEETELHCILRRKGEG